MDNDSMPAMPVPEEVLNVEGWAASGVTKRELFAAFALQGILSGCGNEKWDDPLFEAAALSAVDSADFLIDQLEGR